MYINAPFESTKTHDGRMEEHVTYLISLAGIRDFLIVRRARSRISFQKYDGS